MGLTGSATRTECLWGQSRASICIRIFTKAEISSQNRRNRRCSTWKREEVVTASFSLWNNFRDKTIIKWNMIPILQIGFTNCCVLVLWHVFASKIVPCFEEYAFMAKGLDYSSEQITRFRSSCRPWRSYLSAKFIFRHQKTNERECWNLQNPISWKMPCYATENVNFGQI